jgi:uncharacterized membrane protein
MTVQAFYTVAIATFETVGVIAIVTGLLLSIIFAVITLGRQRGSAAAVRVFRNVFGGSILLGLEIFVAADLVRTITQDPTLTNALTLLIIVAVRTILSWTIQIEIDGVLPWKRALFQSGALVAARGVKDAVS